jgi:hypothetical protein
LTFELEECLKKGLEYDEMQFKRIMKMDLDNPDEVKIEGKIEGNGGESEIEAENEIEYAAQMAKKYRET